MHSRQTFLFNHLFNSNTLLPQKIGRIILGVNILAEFSFNFICYSLLLQRSSWVHKPFILCYFKAVVSYTSSDKTMSDKIFVTFVR